MAHYDIGYDDFAYYALFLKAYKTRNPKISYDQIEKYVKRIRTDLDSYNVDYSIMNGESTFSDISLQPSVTERAKKIKLVKDPERRLYSLNINDYEALTAKINSTIPFFIRSFFEPKGFAELLGLEEPNNQLEK